MCRLAFYHTFKQLLVCFQNYAQVSFRFTLAVKLILKIGQSHLLSVLQKTSVQTHKYSLYVKIKCVVARTGLYFQNGLHKQLGIRLKIDASALHLQVISSVKKDW